MTEFKKFKVSDIFDRAQLGDTNLKKSDLTKTGDIVITSGKTNCGILGRSTHSAKIFPKNTLTIDMFGFVYYRDFPYKMVTHGRVMSLASGIIQNREIGLYLASSLSHLSKVFSYNNMATWKKVQDQELELPVTPSGDPDFAYMTRYIQDLEAQRIQDLDAYLKVSGLDNTTLTDQEKAALTKKVEWKKFRIGDLFERIKLGYTGNMFDVQKDVSKEKNSEFNLPVVSVMTTQNGIMYYGRSSEWSSIENSIDIVQNGVKATGSVFYQPQATSSFRDAYLIKFKQRELTREESLFMVTALKAVLPKTFSRERLATWTRVQDAYFSLPVTSAGAIDFAYMQDYITALEKLNIKDVVAYKDKVIAATKQIVSQQS